MPARWRLLTSDSLVCSDEGSWMVKAPNIEIARITNSAAKAMMIQGFWKAACTWAPAAAAAMPANVFMKAMPST